MVLERRRIRVAAVALAAATAGGLTVVAPATPAAAGGAREVYPVPANGVFAVRGHGYGHGHGMSQFGAYGAALEGLGYKQIVDFYYPGTTLDPRPSSKRVRVLLHDTGSSQVVVDPGSRRLTASTTVAGVGDCVLPTSLDGGKTTVDRWRVRVVSTDAGDRLRLQWTADGTQWSRLPGKTCGTAWAAPLDGDIALEGARLTRLVRSGGGVTRYRGAIVAAFTGSRIFVVNDVLLESYLRSVVPSEMPSSWSAAALQSQAVAARTYATYGIAHPKNKPYYDVFDDTRDQMYTGVGSEIASTDSAVLATTDPAKGVAYVLADGTGHAAFTQFSSSSGGWTVAGGQPYLPAQADPYDGVPDVSWSPHSWRTTLAASRIESAYGGQLGRLRSVEVTGRDGNGDWGGRITGLTLHGSAGDVDVSGATFRYTFGLRSEWFRIVLPPRAPSHVVARRSGGAATVSWDQPDNTGRAGVTGYRVVARPGGATATVAAGARSATVSGLASGTRYRLSVVATSSVGPSDPTTVPGEIARIDADSAPQLAAAASRTTFGAGTARAAVLAATAPVARSLAAAPLAAAYRGPVLVSGHNRLPPATRTELRRVLPAGRTVFLLGSAEVLGDAVRDELRELGYRVDRLGGATAEATARKAASAVAAKVAVTRAVVVSLDDPELAYPAAAAAARRHGVVLLTDGARTSRGNRRWLNHHPDVTRRFAVGADAAAADPAAVALVGADQAATSVLVARRFFGGPARLAVVNPASAPTALVASVRAALGRGPLLLGGPTRLPLVVRGYVTDIRTGVLRADLVGNSLPYADVERDLQRSLLG
jgi:stage II sporulation protein D